MHELYKISFLVGVKYIANSHPRNHYEWTMQYQAAYATIMMVECVQLLHRTNFPPSKVIMITM